MVLLHIGGQALEQIFQGFHPLLAGRRAVCQKHLVRPEFCALQGIVHMLCRQVHACNAMRDAGARQDCFNAYHNLHKLQGRAGAKIQQHCVIDAALALSDLFSTGSAAASESSM